MLMNNFINANWDAPPNIKTLITTRKGGVSQLPYNTLNLGLHVGDNQMDVLQNRQILTKFLPKEPFWLNQTHSDKVVCLDDIEPPLLATIDYDASFTTEKNKVCAIMSADCIPILLTNKNASFVAAIHAGWRGVENGIISKTIQQIKYKLKTTESSPENILAYIAPSICKNHFEVGHDVYKQFITKNTANEIFFTKTNNDKFHCDLAAIAKLQLLDLGICNIFLSSMCTYCNDDLFFSYRRDGITGRIASLIWLT